MKLKVLHVFYQSLPTTIGSTIRSRDLMMGLSKNGITNVAVTPVFQNAIHSNSPVDLINDIKYYRTLKSGSKQIQEASDSTKPIFKQILKIFTIFSFYLRIREVIEKEKPDVIHAHAMFYCFFPSFLLAKINGIPCVYEVRSLWEELRLLDNLNYSQKLVVRIIKFVEWVAFRLSDHIFVISSHLKQDLIRRGIKPDKITIVPNAIVPTLDYYKPNRIDKSINIGYIGGIVKHEGLIEVINSFKHRKVFRNLEFNIYGDGPERKKLENLIKDHRLVNVKLHGSIEPSLTTAVYSKFDLQLLPRIKSNLTDKVTPLKPIEAMHHSKLVIGSKVGGILEIIRNGDNGLIFENYDELEKIFEDLLKNKIDTNKITKRAHQFVLKERNWIINSQKYIQIYDRISKRSD